MFSCHVQSSPGPKSPNLTDMAENSLTLQDLKWRPRGMWRKLNLYQRRIQMKKIVSSLLAVALIAGFALPSFAASAGTCVFTDQAMCSTQSLSDNNVNDADDNN